MHAWDREKLEVSTANVCSFREDDLHLGADTEGCVCRFVSLQSFLGKALRESWAFTSGHQQQKQLYICVDPTTPTLENVVVSCPVIYGLCGSPINQEKL